MRRALAIAVIVLGVGLAIWILRPKKPVSDEEQIRDVIDQVARAAEKKDVSAIAEHVSESYRGEGGDKRELKTYLLAYLMRSEFVGAIPARVQIKAVGDSATVSMLVVLARGNAKTEADLKPELIVGSHKIEARFAREGDDWRVVDAKRRDAGVEDLFK